MCRETFNICRFRLNDKIVVLRILIYIYVSPICVSFQRHRNIRRKCLKAGLRNLSLYLYVYAAELLSKFARINSVLEYFYAVDEDHRNVILVQFFQRSVLFDVDYGDGEFVIASGRQDALFCFLAQMAAGFRVNCDDGFIHGYFEERVIGYDVTRCQATASSIPTPNDRLSEYSM
jgi:hypothetical protein